MAAGKNAYQLHQALWSFFPGHENDNRGFLFRVEHQQKGTGTQILMQSMQKPDENINSPQLLAQRNYDINPCVGQRLRFRLRANPIKTIKDERKGIVTRKGKLLPERCACHCLMKKNRKIGWSVNFRIGQDWKLC